MGHSWGTNPQNPATHRQKKQCEIKVSICFISGYILRCVAGIGIKVIENPRVGGSIPPLGTIIPQ